MKWHCPKARAGLIADVTGLAWPGAAALPPQAVIALPAPELETGGGRPLAYCLEHSLIAAGGE